MHILTTTRSLPSTKTKTPCILPPPITAIPRYSPIIPLSIHLPPPTNKSPPQPAASQPLRRPIIRHPIPKPTPPIPLLRHNRPRTLPAIKPTAVRRTVGIGSTSAGDKLGPWGNCCTTILVRLTTSRRRRLSRRRRRRRLNRWSSRRLSEEGSRSTIIRFRIAETAASVSFLGDDGAGAFSGSEAAAGGGAVGVGGAGAGDELCALCGDEEVQEEGDDEET